MSETPQTYDYTYYSNSIYSHDKLFLPHDDTFHSKENKIEDDLIYSDGDNFQVKEKTENIKQANPINTDNLNSNKGKWTIEEHKLFLDAIILYGNDWKEIQSHLKTRTIPQARSHGQKFLNKILKDEILPMEKEIDIYKFNFKTLQNILANLKLRLRKEEYEALLNKLYEYSPDITNEKNNQAKEKEKNSNKDKFLNIKNDQAQIKIGLSDTLPLMPPPKYIYSTNGKKPRMSYKNIMQQIEKEEAGKNYSNILGKMTILERVNSIPVHIFNDYERRIPSYY